MSGVDGVDGVEMLCLCFSTHEVSSRAAIRLAGLIAVTIHNSQVIIILLSPTIAIFYVRAAAAKRELELVVSLGNG